MDQHFLVEKAEQIAIITLNRPEKRNPINVEMLQEFESILRDLRDDAGTRVVILTGAGNTFSTGADLTVVKGVTDETERRRLFARARRYRIRLISRTLGLLENLEQFTIAAVNGYAVGGGWGLALACDFRIAVPGAQFWFPEVDWGVPLSVGASARLLSMVGATRAKEIIVTCDRYTAEDLAQWGVVNRIVPPDQLLDEARAFADRILAKSANAVTGSKLTVNTLANVAAHEMITLDPEIFIHALDADSAGA